MNEIRPSYVFFFFRFTGKDRQSPHLGWDASNLTSFQRLIIVKVLRPECLVESVRLFVKEQMGSKFVTSVGFDLQEIFEESNNRKPLIFILSPGNCLNLHLQSCQFIGTWTSNY